MRTIKPLTLKEIVEKKLTKKEKELLTTSFDIIGDIAVIEVKKELEKKEKIIGDAILNLHKNIMSVFKRAGIHKGKFRTQKLKLIAGKNRKVTIHKESGCLLEIDVEKCYFSIRSGTERLRITDLIKKKYEITNEKEKILVMFSGIGPFVFVIGKNAPYKKIIGIELNKVAHFYAENSLKINKIKDINLFCGDVRKIVPKLKEKFDRILMPLPRTAEDFLDTALLAAKKGTIIHLYAFLSKDEFDEYKQKIFKISKKSGFKIRILNVVKCGQFSPKMFRICVDFQII